IANAVLPHVALGGSRLITPRVNVSTRAPSGLLPLLTGGQLLAGPLRVGVRILPSHEDNGMIVLPWRWLTVLPVTWGVVPGCSQKPGVLRLANGVDIDVVGRQPYRLVARAVLEHASVHFAHQRPVEWVATLARADELHRG